MFFGKKISQPINIFYALIVFFLEILSTSVKHNVFGENFLNLILFYVFDSIFLEILATGFKTQSKTPLA